MTLTREYARRYEAIAAGIEGPLARWLRVVPSAAGMHVTATLQPKAAVDLARVVSYAAERGVAVRRLADFYLGPPATDGLVLGYGGIPATRLGEGLTRLAAAFAAAAR